MTLMNDVPKMRSDHWLKKKVAFGPATVTYCSVKLVQTLCRQSHQLGISAKFKHFKPMPSAVTTTLAYFEFREPLDVDDDGRSIGIGLTVVVPKLLGAGTQFEGWEKTEKFPKVLRHPISQPIIASDQPTHHRIRSANPSSHPISQPIIASDQPTHQPTHHRIRSANPSANPSSHPISQPIIASDQPTHHRIRSANPSSHPISQPISQPIIASDQPTHQPTHHRIRSANPSSHPICYPKKADGRKRQALPAACCCWGEQKTDGGAGGATADRDSGAGGGGVRCAEKERGPSPEERGTGWDGPD
uniref:Uncharacterized protein n=1 Tax=Globodera rostochiensis TaxID=31243 RepID=A0A914I4H8_GLORO